ncbi:MAG: glycoside hydrolase family 16 protein [Planctomycetota bacterium]
MENVLNVCPLIGRPRGLRLLFCLQMAFGALSYADLSTGQSLDLPGWDLYWHDEFDGVTLDTSKWEALNRRNSFNYEKQYYHPDQVTVADGNLQLTAINVPRAGKPYQSGLITSRDLFGPGRFEARVNLPTSKGMWPAFWLNANQVDWPQGGEIDILENRGSKPNLVSSAYHWQTNPGPCCDGHQYVFGEYMATENGQPVDFHAGFHTYAAEWDETSVRYYVDGNLHFTVTEGPDRPIFETPKNIIVNLAVGGTFDGDPDATTVWPQTMLVDYVRVWLPEGTSPPEPDLNLLSNPGFDAAGGSLDHWDVFGNTIPNVLANSDLSNDGADSLKIFGQFNGPGNQSGVSQRVPVTEGNLLEAVASTYSPAWDTLVGKSNDVTMKVEFYSEIGATSGSSNFLGEVTQLVHDGLSSENTWLDHSLEVVAPEGAVEARLSFIFNQAGNDNGAVWIDSTGLFLQAALAGDYNEDGVVDIADFTVWRDGNSPDDSIAGYELWKNNFGATTPAPLATLFSQSVPEPTAAVCLLVACGGLVLRRIG